MSEDTTIHDRRFLRAIVDFGHEAWFLRLADAGTGQTPFESNEGVRLVAWPRGASAAREPGDIPRLVPAFQEILKSVRPDVVHAGPVPTGGYLAALSRFHPFLLMSWGSDVLVDCGADWRRAVEAALKASDLILCDSGSVAARVRDIASRPSDWVVQLPWGVDLDRFAPGPDALKLRNRRSWNDGFLILSTRSWEPIYGVPTLVQAFAEAHRSDPRMRLVLLGSGSLAGEVNSVIEDRGIGQAVHRAGLVPHDQVRDYFLATDLYASASVADGTSVSLLEALATGLPVIVSDIPGNREWVAPGLNGWLAPPGDVKELAARFVDAASMTPSERRRMGSANRVLAEARADWGRNSDRLRKAYVDLSRP